MGKSALLEYLLDGASGCRTARTAGVESEMEVSTARTAGDAGSNQLVIQVV
jgi:hypothetical protein